jgi:alpha-L-arabinofuranosidase
MASGVYNRLNLAATTDTVVVSSSAVASGKTAVITVSMCNQNATNVTVRLAISANSTPGQHEYLEYETNLNNTGVLERTGIVLPNGLNLIARSSAANVSVLAYGIEG